MFSVIIVVFIIIIIIIIITIIIIIIITRHEQLKPNTQNDIYTQAKFTPTHQKFLLVIWALMGVAMTT